MKVILPAAGYATRMWPLTLDKPKALLKVGGKAIIDHIVERVCCIKDVNEILVVTNNKFYLNFLEWKKGVNFRIRLKILNDGTMRDKERLGAVGDINFVLEKEGIDEDFIVINSDNLFSFDLVSMYEDFRSKRKSIVSIYDVKDLKIAKRMGNLRFDDERRIIYFKEKDPDTSSTLCSVGIYFFTREVVSLIKMFLDEGNSGDRSGDFLEWLYKNEDIYGYVFNSKNDKWFDIGDLESYKLAKRTWKNISQ